MRSLRELYRIGRGPSSSHTMGPAAASRDFIERPGAGGQKFRVTLYGSLAATGKGHLTDAAVLDVLGNERTEILWEPETVLPRHPNGMRFDVLNADGSSSASALYFSTGGGAILGPLPVEEVQGESSDFAAVPAVSPYSIKTIREILPRIESEGKTLWEYVFDHEDREFTAYLVEVWKVMQEAIDRGVENEGLLPGPLKLSRKASSYLMKSRSAAGFVEKISTTFAYALAVSEENASGGVVVTAPTCGSSGVLPAVLKTLQETYRFSEQRIVRALATAGLIGNLVKTNGSISGAEVGCQGEVGTACAMAAAAAAQLLGGTPRQIEYAAEMGLEHHLGLTCDPVLGLVQVPCIERNAVAATRAIDAASYALLSDGRHMVSLDEVVDTMLQTGRDMSGTYRETSTGGLAMFYNRDELEAQAKLGRTHPGEQTGGPAGDPTAGPTDGLAGGPAGDPTGV